LIDVELQVERPSATAMRLVRLLGPEGPLADLVATVRTGSEGPPCTGLILVSRRLLGEAPARALAARCEGSKADWVVLSEQEDDVERLVMVGAGAASVLNISVDDGILCTALHNLLQRRFERKRMERTLASASQELALDEDETTLSEPMRHLLRQARKVARSPAPVLLLGATGTGKEWLARALHNASPRRSGPFVAINCSAVPETLFEAELFGVEKGAYTGADATRRGVFESADGGTLLLDEVADLPERLQPKLLRVLEDQRIQRLGSDRSFKVDVRFLSATSRESGDDNKQVLAPVRRDLYFRLAATTLRLPPLSDRRPDLPGLVERFLSEARKNGARGQRFTHEALAILQDYSWPGNVRELRHTVEHAAYMADAEELGVDDLPQEVVESVALEHVGDDQGVLAGVAGRLWSDELLATSLPALRAQLNAELERRYAQEALTVTKGRVGEAATIAQIDRRSFTNIMRRWGLRKEEYRPSGE
jgi:DNA-binding NtrC family response regulator